MDERLYERIPMYEPYPAVADPLIDFKDQWQNTSFRRSTFTWITLFFLVIAYPFISVAFAEDPSEALRGLNETVLIVLLLSTILMQWGIFALILLTATRERTGLPGLGFKPIRGTDFLWAGAFLLGANLVLSGLAWILAQVGLPMSGDIKFLIPQDTLGRIVWVAVSITAGVVEETAFRGYLMTRIRLLGNLQSWTIPVVVSSLIFGSLHAYQGLPGVIVIAAYGFLFALLYIRTGSIWPGIIAHTLQDLSALFFPQ